MRYRHQKTRWAGAVLGLVLLGGCRADVTVGVDAEADGGGEVSAKLVLDREAGAQVPDLDRDLRLSDLQAAGWRVDGPRRLEDGSTEVRATKAFASPAAANRALTELSGPDGPFRQLRLQQRRSFWKTRTAVSGSVDLTSGLEAFSDASLAQRLGGRPLGVDLRQVEQQTGKPLSELFGFEVTADLPGEEGGQWRPALGRRMEVNASAEAWHTTRIIFTAVCALATLALVAVLAGRAFRGTFRDT